ncbi:12587_t:CDS:1, partial [Rhizophagus irregularis]
QHGRSFIIFKPSEETLTLYAQKCLGADPLKRPSAFELLYILL